MSADRGEPSPEAAGAGPGPHGAATGSRGGEGASDGEGDHASTAGEGLRRAFFLTWVGQLVSLFGSGLTSFALGLVVYTESGGSITQFSLVYFFYYLPPILIAPFAGSLVDRWDRRRAMIASDLGAAAVAFATLGLLAASSRGWLTLRPYHLFVPMALTSACDAVRWPAYYAATALLVPKAQLGRANGLLELVQGLAQILVPALGGVALARLGLRGVLLIDLLTFVPALATLFAVRFPAPPRGPEGAAPSTLWQETAAGWRWLRERRGLLGLIAFAAAYNTTIAFVTLLFTPLVMSFADVRRLGWVISIAGLGALVGGIAASAWGGPRRRVRGLVVLQALTGATLLFGLLPPTVPRVAGVAFAVMALTPLIASCLQTLWQRKVPPQLHGRVFAVRRMIGLSAPVVATLIAGPIAARLFEPLLLPGGGLAGSLGRLVGVGPGRGIGLLDATLGGLGLVTAAALWLSPRVRRLEVELPDTLPDAPLAPTKDPR